MGDERRQEIVPARLMHGLHRSEPHPWFHVAECGGEDGSEACGFRETKDAQQLQPPVQRRCGIGGRFGEKFVVRAGPRQCPQRPCFLRCGEAAILQRRGQFRKHRAVAPDEFILRSGAPVRQHPINLSNQCRHGHVRPFRRRQRRQRSRSFGHNAEDAAPVVTRILERIVAGLPGECPGRRKIRRRPPLLRPVAHKHPPAVLKPCGRREHRPPPMRAGRQLPFCAVKRDDGGGSCSCLAITGGIRP